MTPFEKLRDFVERNRMQSSYSKEQIIELIDLIYLDLEKQQIIKAYEDGMFHHVSGNCPDEYYNEKYNK
jgi:hypothetical protein